MNTNKNTMTESLNEDTVTPESKWGTGFAQGCLIGEKLVDLVIPKDRMNPSDHVWISLNGSDAFLATGIRISVPESIRKLYNYSYDKTLEAEESISRNVEIN